jgi:CheY-like chemotaxis protein
MANEGLVEQALVNLLDNAIKYGPEGGSVRIEASPDLAKEFINLDIRDEGPGIPAKDLPRLFERFYRVDRARSRELGGTGLGLSISKKLVEVMQGQIGVNSNFGEGSCFWFEIPTLAATAQDIQNANLNENFESQRPLSILVAEDNPPNQLLIRAILTKLNHQVTIAVNGQKVLDFLTDSTQHYDLVLMDMQMPEMDGLEATRRIRQLSGDLANIPIVALTANALVGDRERVLEAGMNDYLSKPIDIHALKRALWQWSQ